MPLSSNLPVIDNRRYDDIVAELRTRIPRYTPEWTDLNDNDPGITLVQLFAWLGDMLLYRMGRVPDLNYLKFLELIGIQLLPAEPATAEVAFPVSPTASPLWVIVPLGTQVSADSTASPTPIVYETDRAIVAIKATLQSVQAFDGFGFDDKSTENDDAIDGFQPFGPGAGVDAALYLGFDPAVAMPQVVLDLAFVAADEGAPKYVSCNIPPSTRFASGTLLWEYWTGTEWRAFDQLSDTTLALTISGHIQLKTPAPGIWASDTFGEITDPRRWMRGRVLIAQYETPPKLLAVRTNTVSVTQAQTVTDEVLGGSDGTENQVFKLANAPVLDGTLELQVDQGDGFADWTAVTDLFGTGPQDQVYVLDRTTGEIRFGDGTNGAIPVGNVDLPGSNIVARKYRFGGGAPGNVPAMAIKTLLGTIDGVDADKIGNLLPAVGGSDEESLDAAKLRAPRAIQSRGRAVTAQDFEQLATQAGPIRRAKALPLTHPDFPGVQVPGVVSVIVVPDGTAPNPTPSEGTLRYVCACLDKARLVTTELYILPPTYRLVKVTADVTADDRADLAAVKTAIETALLSYFHPLTGGEDGQGWPFGGPIFYSRVYGRASVDGVQSIEHLIITLDGFDAPECTNVPICPGELVYSVDHAINVTYASAS
jgi:predicted phage baseplate assembly protein